MSKLTFALMLSALVFVVVAAIAYGSTALIFPFTLLLMFVFLFLVLALEAYVQMQRTPGIEKLQEPYWMSIIYNTWLFTTNRDAWAKYAATLSLVGSAIVGTMMGAIFMISIHETGPVAYVSWLTGFFLTGTIAAGIAAAEHWTKKTEAGAKLTS